MAGQLFERHVELYDALIDWPKRLANEGPFLRAVFDRCGARRVLDAACGTGQHAAMFHSWGLVVEGADVSPAMIARCRQQFGESGTLRWTVRGFEEPAPAAFDAVVCLGNSLALAGSRGGAQRAVAAMLASLRSGGFCVIQVLNLWSLPEGPCIWQKFRRARVDGREHLLAKGVHRHAGAGFVEFLALPVGADEEPSYETVRLTGLTREDLAAFASAGGARQVEFFGNYARDAYEPQRSVDLIAVVEKA
jgi:SAM-dependent methyltransferase